MSKDKSLETLDPEVFAAIQDEVRREQANLIMIASENYASPAVIEAQANVMTNKYAEGYPGARYYGGCEFVDKVERLASERGKRLFNSEYVNVQPHSGSQANMAVYMSMLNPGDTILGMELSQGGHLTHGSSVSFSGKIFRSVSYGVDKDSQRIDYNQVRELAKEHRPKMIIAGASAYSRIIDFHAFKDIARETGSYLMADMAHIAGLVATGLHPSPVGLADFVTSSTHKTLRGPRGGLILCGEELGPRIAKGVFPGIQGGPLMHIIAAKAVAFGEALRPQFTEYQKQVVKNAGTLADELKGYGFDIVSGGTDTHLLLLDLSSRGITGQKAENTLAMAGIAANKNSVPFDKNGPKITSGLRLGTPALTTRGMLEGEMRLIAGLIRDALSNPDSETVISHVKQKVSELCSSFPVYGQMGEGN